MYTQLVGFAHAVGGATDSNLAVDDNSSLALRVVVVSVVALLLLVIVALLNRDTIPKLKMSIFVLIITTSVISTLLLVVSAFDHIKGSDSDGAVNWAAGYEIWACGNQLELRDPEKFISNRIGSATLHEHDDQLIHVNGVVINKQSGASLGAFFHDIGGRLTEGRLIVPLNDESGRWFENTLDSDGLTENNTALITINIISNDESGTVADFTDGGLCGNEPAFVQTYVYHYEETDAGDVFWQEKLVNPAQYTIAEYIISPPGDCIIFEYGPENDRTEKICKTFDDLDNEVKEVGAVTDDGDIIELDDIRSNRPTEIKPLEGLDGVEDAND